MKKYIIILSALLFWSCEDTIEVDLGDTLGYYSIDAWLNDQPGRQKIFVGRTQPYFENEFPTLLSGATVYVTDLGGNRYDFVEESNGYFWGNDGEDSFIQVGMGYVLTVEAGDHQFVSYAEVGRVPPIDSLIFSYYEDGDNFINGEHYLAEFVATDPVGEGDAYWIKTWKNSWYLNQPDEINVSFDAGGSPGAIIDGVPFIQPIQFGINPFDPDPDSEQGQTLPPYLVGDSIHVEIHSIDLAAFFFLNEVRTQTTPQQGFGALFAAPISNVSSNIFNVDEESQVAPVGFFNVSAISKAGLLLTEEIAEEAKRQYYEKLE